MAAARREEPVAAFKGIVREARQHGEGGNVWLAVGIELDGHAQEMIVAADVEVAPVLYPGREVTVEVRLR